MQIDSAVIFAGGKSSRMGKDKSLMPFGSYSSMAELQYRKLGKIFDNIYISAKSDKFDFGPNIISDKFPESSPMVAIVSILEQILDEAIFFLSVDTPMIDSDIITQLLNQYYSMRLKPDILIAKTINGMEPLCGIYGHSVLKQAKVLLNSNNHKIHDLLKEVNTATLLFEDKSKFININTPKEYNSILP